MRLAKYQQQNETRVGILLGESISPLKLTSNFPSLASILHSDDPTSTAKTLIDPNSGAIETSQIKLMAPIDSQEVWAAGVTYKRSKTARMEESEAAASCYDRVYASDRPEIFFKATPHRVAGPGQPLRIRVDSKWNVPEPEVTLVISPAKKIVGYTIGNDMSSRDIEGDNPLYLPQAKMYDQCCGLGPTITLVDEIDDVKSMAIELEIFRNNQVVFSGKSSVAEMAREFEDLVQWLGRDNSLPNGAFLLTGTGIVPDNDFTLSPKDEVRISVSGIGTLSNTIVQG